MRLSLASLTLAVSLAPAGFIGGTTAAIAEGDVAAGEKVFRRCAACHAVGVGAKNKVGPQLNGVVGRLTGSVDGVKYGAGLTKLNEQGHVWTEDAMTQYIVGPADYVQEVTGEKLQAKMVAQRLKDKDLANVIAYLATFDADGNAVE